MHRLVLGALICVIGSGDWVHGAPVPSASSISFLVSEAHSDLTGNFGNSSDASTSSFEHRKIWLIILLIIVVLLLICCILSCCFQSPGRGNGLKRFGSSTSQKQRKPATHWNMSGSTAHRIGQKPLGPPPSPAPKAATQKALPEAAVAGSKLRLKTITKQQQPTLKSVSTFVTCAETDSPTPKVKNTPSGTVLSNSPKLTKEEIEKQKTALKNDKTPRKAASDVSFQIVGPSESLESTKQPSPPPQPKSIKSKRRLGVGTRSRIFSGRPAKNITRSIQSVSSQRRWRHPPPSSVKSQAKIGRRASADSQHLSPFEVKSPSSITSYQTVMYANELNIHSLLNLARKHHERRQQRPPKSDKPKSPAPKYT